MVKINLFDISWSNYQNSNIEVNFIGYCDFQGQLLINAEDIYTFLKNQNKLNIELHFYLYQAFLPEVNGNFAIIIRIESIYFLMCDHCRSYPLYLVREKSLTTVSDHLGKLKVQKLPDLLAMEEFILSGFVTGNRTVFENVNVVQAGEMVIISESEIKFDRYFKLKSDPLKSVSIGDNKATYIKMDALFNSVVRRMIKSCPDVNNWIVPLSGGHDSRLIINYLYKLGCKNVICYTYGVLTSKEAEISKYAAEALGYKWYFIQYSSEEWQKLSDNHDLDTYINFSFNGCCLPHIQDLLAIYKLKKLSIITEKDVIVPGHTAFTEVENYAIKDLLNEKESFKYVFNRYFNLFKCNMRYTSFEKFLKQIFDDGMQSPNSFPEYFNWQERQSKFINNSVRVYEFYGLRWRIPFWEKCVIDFWQNISFDDRIERKIFFNASIKYLLNNELINIPFIDKFCKPKNRRNFLLNVFPESVISYVVRILNRKPIIAEGTNLVFANRTSSVNDMICPLIDYPPNINKHIKNILLRKPYQVNSNTLMAIYTLRNEVLTHN